jgi:hypothetical protein
MELAEKKFFRPFRGFHGFAGFPCRTLLRS